MKLIAHRGASAHAPENTLAAFGLALGMGAKEMELDIHQTRDGRLVVTHDPNLKRVTGLKQLIKNLSWDEMKDLDCGKWYDARFAGERLPLLDEVLDLAAGLELLHVEIKEGNTTYPGIEANLLGLLRRKKALERVSVSSFHHPTLLKLRELDRRVKLGFLVDSLHRLALPRVLKAAAGAKAYSLDISRKLASAALVDKARAQGMKVLAYTVNDAAEWKRLEGLGVVAVFSDHPELSAESGAVGGTEA